MGNIIDWGPEMQANLVSIVIIVLSGITCLSIFLFCRMHHVQVAEIEEYYAKQEQHRGLHYLFKICIFVIGTSLAYNMKSMVMKFLTKIKDHTLHVILARRRS